jgi:hypothetical protein
MSKYLLRIDDDKFWQEVRMKALRVRMPVSRVILCLLRLWLKGKVKLEDPK